MLDKYNNVFILGAGASKPYGFPLGLELNNLIRKYFYNNMDLYINRELRSPSDAIYTLLLNNAKWFSEEFNKVQDVLIDKYLNINKNFVEQGKISIISEIYKSEFSSVLPLANYDIKGDWYSYLYKKIISGFKFENIKDLEQIYCQNKISFITFNYDRSLEHYLFESLFGLFKNAGGSRKVLANILSKIPILHIYGKIGNLPWQKGYDHIKFYNEEKKVLSFGNLNNYNSIKVALKYNDMIQIMYEQRKISQDIIDAKKMIKDADRVFFLGFGYDPDNVELLDLPKLLKGKEVFGTALNKTEHEIHLHRKLLNLHNSAPTFQPCDCLQLLRDFLE